MTWTLESELAGFADLEGSPIDRVLVSLGLVREASDVEGVVPRGDWVRGGAETYILYFDVVDKLGTQTPFLLKACVALGDLSGTESIVAEWFSRRRMLERAGVATAQTYGVHRSTIIEEFVPFTIQEALSQSREHRGRTRSLLAQMGWLAGKLTVLGFPVLSLSDLRSRGRDVVMVDFGEDLGPSGLASRTHSQILDQVVSAAEKGMRLRPHDYEAIERGFASALRNP